VKSHEIHDSNIKSDISSNGHGRAVTSWSPRKRPATPVIAAGLAAAGALIGVGGYYLATQLGGTGQGSADAASAGGVYTADGDSGGGYAGRKRPDSGVAPARGVKPGSQSALAPGAAKAKTADPLRPALALYRAGRYVEAEAAAAPVLAAVAARHDAPLSARKAAARARRLTAFAAARRKDLALARERFALARKEAALLPDHGKQEVKSLQGGMLPSPTVEEDAAYQHAVCTAALGDKAGAEKEYVAFMKAYPESPLVQASIKRIARLHGGDIPKAAEAAWRQAMDTAQARDKARRRDASLCAPECLAELVRRQGSKGNAGGATSVKSLASEMKTDEDGTTLSGLRASARKHGFPGARGLALTWEGLKKQKLPLIALVAPRHFVLVEQVSESGGVRVWDPDGGGATGRAATRSYSREQWRQAWSEGGGGVALALESGNGGGTLKGRTIRTADAAAHTAAMTAHVAHLAAVNTAAMETR
jgi:hypothetical protein